MSKKIKVVEIGHQSDNQNEVTNKEANAEEAVETVEEKPKEDVIIEETIKEAMTKNDDERITEEIDKPKPSRKMVSCPDCGKSMLEKNFRYQHINVCGKVKTPKLRAKPIEEVIKEKREKAKSTLETQTKQPEVIVEKPIETPPPPPPKPDYWTLRKEYVNQMRERRTILAKRLVSKAF